MNSQWHKLYLFVLLIVFAVFECSALDIYILRHAQTMANVTREYTDEHQRAFSALGVEQVEGVSAKLAPYAFDAILVSPAWRTRHTILPVLKERGITAEIWPELDECCWDRKTQVAISDLPRGPEIEIEEDLTEWLSFRDADATRFFEAITPETGDYQVELAVNLIRERYGDSDKSILVVTHYHTGARLIRALTPDAPARLYLHNTALSHLAPDAKGQLRLLILNDKPFEANDR